MPFFRGHRENASPLPLTELEGRNRADWLLWGGVIVLLLGLVIWIRGPLWTWHAFLAAWVRLWHLITFWFHPVHSFYALGWPQGFFHALNLPARPPAPRTVGQVPTPPTAAHSATAPRWPLALLFGTASASPWALGLVAVSRILTRWQRARGMTWTEIQLFQHDESTPSAMTAVLDTIYAATRVRSTWMNTAGIYRWFLGEPPWTLQIVRDPIHPTMPHGIHLVLGAPSATALRSIQNALRTTYTNLRFLPWTLPMERRWPYVARWSLRRGIGGDAHLVRLLTNYDTIPLETLIQALARDTFAHEDAPPFVFQWTMTPVSIGRARRRLEYRTNRAQWEGRATEQQAARQALTQIGHGRFRVEWRLAADSWEVVQKAAGAWASENRQADLRLRLVLIWKGFWVRWMAAGLPGLWPWARSIPLWSGELASFLALPTGRLRIADLTRSMTRRMPASQRLPRQPALTLMRAEPDDPVGIAEVDRFKNILVRGTQGAGKSQALLRVFRADVRAIRPEPAPVPDWGESRRDRRGDPLKAVVLLDIGKDTAKAALRLVPPDREVLWVDPTRWDNPWQLQPFAGTNDRATRTAQILELLLNVFGDEAIRDRSKHLLRSFIATALEADPRASFATVYRMMTDDAFRNTLQQLCQDPLLRLFWDKEWPALAKNPKFLQEIMDAPRNKLGALLYHPFIRSAMAGDLGDPAAVATQWVQTLIDWDRVLRERQVVIFNLPKSDLGDEGTRLLGTTAVLSLWNAIERQAHLPEAERVPCSLIIDEAQNFISAGFAAMLAEGRALGLQMTLAVRFLGEVANERAQAAIEELCHHLIVFRVHQVEEAKTLMHLMQRLYANNITFAEDVQALTNFAVDDFLHLPDHHAICFWQAYGEIQPPFVAESIPWRPLDADADWDAQHEAWAAGHLARQPHPPDAAASDAVRNPSHASEPSQPGDAHAFDIPSPWQSSAETHPLEATPPASDAREAPPLPVEPDAFTAWARAELERQYGPPPDAGDPADRPIKSSEADAAVHPPEAPESTTDPEPPPATVADWAAWLRDHGHNDRWAATVHTWVQRHPDAAAIVAQGFAESPPDRWASVLQWVAWADGTAPKPTASTLS